MPRAIQDWRHLLRVGWQPPRFRSPLPRGRGDRRQGGEIRGHTSTAADTCQLAISYGNKRGSIMRRVILLVAVGATALALVVGVALATQPSGVTATPLTRATLGEFKAKNDGIKVK